MKYTSPIVAFTGRIHEAETQAWLLALNKALPDVAFRDLDSLEAAERDACQIAVVANPDPQRLRQLPNLIWIHSVWAGVERLLTELQDTHWPIIRLTDPNLATTMAEAVLAWCLYLQRDMPAYRQQQQAAHWRPLAYKPTSEWRVGVLGLGLLGQACAERLQSQGFHVQAWRRHQPTAAAGPVSITCFVGDQGLTEMLSSSDIIVNLLPLTPETTGLINADFWQRCRSGIQLINFGRGATVVEADLLQALAQQQVRHAVLDVFAIEPLPREHIFWRHPDITLLPHISAPTSVASASQIVADNIKRYFERGILPASVDRGRGY